MKKLFITLFFLISVLLWSGYSNAQINIGPGVVNAYYKVNGISGTTVSVGTTGGASHTLSPGDKVILIQMTGSTDDNGGVFEYADVVSVSGSSVQLSNVDRSYSPSSEAVQLVWVPSDPVSIVLNGDIAAMPYDGSIGGIVSVFTNGILVANGDISADGAGFEYGQNTISGSVYHGGGGGGLAGGGGGGGYGEGGKKGGACYWENGVNIDCPEDGGYNGGKGVVKSYQGNDNSLSSGSAGGGGVGSGGGGGSGAVHGGGGGGGAGYTIGGDGAQGSCADNGVGCGSGGAGHVNGTGGSDGGDGGSNGAFTGGGGGGGGSKFVGGGGGGAGGDYTIPPGSGGKFGGNGGAGGGAGYGSGTGGDGGGTLNSFTNYQYCDNYGNCDDPRVWLGGGGGFDSTPGLNPARGGGIVLVYGREINVPGFSAFTAHGEDADLRQGGGGGGIVAFNTHAITGFSLRVCANGGSGGAGVVGPKHGSGSGGAGGGGVVWVYDPLGGVGDNSSGLPPAVNRVYFCDEIAEGGAVTPNPKNASWTGGGGNGGQPFIVVNDNCQIFGTCYCELRDLDFGITNETCNNNGTGIDPSDDYITFDLNPTGKYLGTTYTVSADNGGTVTPTTGTYGSATTFRLQNGSADGITTYTITVTDSGDNGCTATTTVQEGSCSNVCDLIDGGKTNQTCNNNGTLSDASDDYISFDLNPTGSNLNSRYTVSVDNGGTITPAGSAYYGSATTFRLQNGSANGSTYTVTITDSGDSGCTTTVTVQESSCSECPTEDCLDLEVIKD